MSTAAGDPWTWPYPTPYWQWPHPYYGGQPSTADNTGCRPFVAVDEETVRRIIREELTKALESLKEQK